MNDTILNTIDELRYLQQSLAFSLIGGSAKDWTSYREAVMRNRTYEEIIEVLKEEMRREEESSGTFSTIPGTSQEVDTE